MSGRVRKNMVAVVVRVLLVSALVPLIAVSRLAKWGRAFRRPVRNGNRRLVMIGTFYNPGWFYAHVGPLLRCEYVDEVYVITDEPVTLEMQGVNFYCPSETLKRRIGRELSRLWMVLKIGWEKSPSYYMGYHIMPNAPLALLGAALFGGKAIYQMTGGPIQVVDGGYQSENPLLRATLTPSRLQEKLLFALVRGFDAVVVRGEAAKQFVLQEKLASVCFVITGAMDTERFSPSTAGAEYDLVCVTRLVPVKGLEFLLEVTALVAQSLPGLRLALVGEGPLRASLEQRCIELSIVDNVRFLGKLTDVRPVLNNSKAFILLSESEGMSIAMLEALACGLPVIVTDVGDLKDAFQGADALIGSLIVTAEKSQVARDVMGVIGVEAERQTMAKAARELACNRYSVDAMTAVWNTQLHKLLDT